MAVALTGNVDESLQGHTEHEGIHIPNRTICKRTNCAGSSRVQQNSYR
jgi:hypothetical protein